MDFELWHKLIDFESGSALFSTQTIRNRRRDDASPQIGPLFSERFDLRV